MTTIRITYGSGTAILTCDLAQASAPLVVDGSPIGLQTADARHRTALAVAIAARHAWPDATWPEIPATGSVPDGWADGCEAWDGLEYEAVEAA